MKALYPAVIGLLSVAAICAATIAEAQAYTAPPRPVRDPQTPGYVPSTELPDGQIPDAGQNGNFVIGPTHAPAPEMVPAADTPHGAWGFHETLIPNNPKKPIRLWMMVGDHDLYNPNVMRDNMHDWVVANEEMAKVLTAKGYDYQFVFARNAGHGDKTVKQQTLPEALEWLWQGYKPLGN